MHGLGEIERFWSERASRFDDEPDHGLGDPLLRDAWGTLLRRAIPDAQQRVADLGCGTGSLSLLLSEQGHTVVGIDLSARMAGYAEQKFAAAGRPANFIVGDAANPALLAGAFDVVLCRHLLWTLPDPPAALARWRQLLRPTGRLIAVEGQWNQLSEEDRRNSLPWDGGVPATVLLEALNPLFSIVEHIPLSNRSDLWGKQVSDERYALVATAPR